VALEQHGGHRRKQLNLAVHHHGVQAFLAAEVLIARRLSDVRLGGDLLNRRALEGSLR